MKTKNLPKAADTKLPVYFNLSDSMHVEAVQITAMAASMNAAVACASGQCNCNKHHFENET